MVTLRRRASSELPVSSVNAAERKFPTLFGINRKMKPATAVSSATDRSIPLSGAAKENITLHKSAENTTATFPIEASKPPISPPSA